jgi:hypothetical protein
MNSLLKKPFFFSDVQNGLKSLRRLQNVLCLVCRMLNGQMPVLFHVHVGLGKCDSLKWSKNWVPLQGHSSLYSPLVAVLQFSMSRHKLSKKPAQGSLSPKIYFFPESKLGKWKKTEKMYDFLIFCPHTGDAATLSWSQHSSPFHTLIIS